MSEQLGLGDVISDSLNLEAQVIHAMGKDWTRPDASSAGDSRCPAAMSTGPAGSSSCTYWMYCGDLRHEEGEQIYNQAMAYCDVHDIGTSAQLLAGRARWRL